MSNPHFAANMPVRLYESESSLQSVTERFGIEPATVIDFSLNINPFGPPRAAMEAARAALEHCHEYPDLKLSQLRRALARRHEIAEDALLFGAGLDDVIKLLLHALTSEGGQVLIPLPTFPRYELEARLRGARVVLLENDPPWTIALNALAATLTRTHVELAFLCSPNNPTGETLPPEQIAALAASFPETMFVVDEALIHPPDEGVLPLVRDSGNVIVLRTFSKYFGLAGLRVGYAIGDPAVLHVVEQGRPPFNVSRAAEMAAIAVLDDESFVAGCQAMFRQESAYFCAGLEGLPGYRVRGRNANMLLLEVLDHPVSTVIDGLAAQGLLVADAACFGGLGDYAAIRVSLRDRAANRRLLAALEMLR
jgi:histidinol-phosphate aminotransferase